MTDNTLWDCSGHELQPGDRVIDSAGLTGVVAGVAAPDGDKLVVVPSPATRTYGLQVSTFENGGLVCDALTKLAP